MQSSPRAATLLALLVAGAGAAGRSPEPPSVIILSLIDDLGFSDIQPNGAWSPTPHMGQLAEQGVKLQHMHGPPAAASRQLPAAASRQLQAASRSSSPGACLSRFCCLTATASRACACGGARSVYVLQPDAPGTAQRAAASAHQCQPSAALLELFAAATDATVGEAEARASEL
eukprot:COSAG01_NODE_3691_length_5790_cov_3.696011_8_plen_173_part_00